MDLEVNFSVKLKALSHGWDVAVVVSWTVSVALRVKVVVLFWVARAVTVMVVI
jgi:hypothetical protein